MFEGTLFIHYPDYTLSTERRIELENLRNNIKCSLVENDTDEQCQEIGDTRAQSNSDTWKSERLFRITASKCKTANILGDKIAQNIGNQYLHRMSKFIKENLWYPSNFISADMRYGMQEEHKARSAYSQYSGNTVIETGMWVNKDYPCLGASPDGLILDDSNEASGVLEIKCLKIFRNSSVSQVIEKSMDKEMSKTLSRQCFEIKDKKLKLKENHQYYYQIQLQMLVTGLTFCDFVLHSPHGPPSVERIYANVPFQKSLSENITFFGKTSISLNTLK